MRPRVALLTSRIRVEEKLLLRALEARGVDTVQIDDERTVFPLDRPPVEADVVFSRSVHFGRTLAALRIFERFGLPTVNRSSVV